MNSLMYEMSVPMMKRSLENLIAILEKANNYSETLKLGENVLLQSRLYPDMHPLIRQVQIACDFAKNGASRLGGAQPRVFEDTETTIPQLITRAKNVLEILSSLKPADFVGAETRDVTFNVGPKSHQMKGLAYLQTMVLPNFYFHITTAYAILRHNGLPLGKMDFIGAF